MTKYPVSNFSVVSEPHLANTVRNPCVVVIKFLNTMVARRPMLGTYRLDYLKKSENKNYHAKC